MSDSKPSIGIDFGTSNSSMAWFDPRSGTAEVIRNAEGEDKTPSLVYFGENETLVGKPVEKMLQRASADRTKREEIVKRTVKSIKRDLLRLPRIPIAGGRYVEPVEVVAEILKKLKGDAEDGHFHEEIKRAVITCPAQFGKRARKVIEDAGHRAGFEEVELLEEPVAGALAYARAGLNVGKHVLVYDLGEGTFDLAVLENEGESFEVAGEVLGLKWSDIDFDAGTLRVNHQLQRVRRDGDKSGSLVFSEPKNASRRAVGLPPRAIRALREHRKRQLEEKLQAGSEWQDNGLVFTNSKGSPLEAQNVVPRSFKPLLERAGLPPIRFHDLRHSCLSLLASRGEPIRDLQALAGQATASFTLQRYTHHYGSSMRRTADTMGGILPEEP